MCSPADYQTGSERLLGCRDGIKNGNETAVDCGGDVCDKCVLGDTCVMRTDCYSNTCASGVCRDRHCADSVVDQDEQGVDCGGVDCAPCVGSATCGNKVQDPGETGIDCGGPTDCDRCANGATCTIGTDCISSTCVASICRSTNSGVGGAQGVSGAGGIPDMSGGGTNGVSGASFGTNAGGAGAEDGNWPGAGESGSGGMTVSSAGSKSATGGGSSRGGAWSTIATETAVGGNSSATATGLPGVGGSSDRGGTGGVSGREAVGGRGGGSATGSGGATASAASGLGATGGTSAVGGKSGSEKGGSAGAAGGTNVCSHKPIPSALLVTDFSEFAVGLTWTSGGKPFGTYPAISGDTFHFANSSTPLTATITSGGALRLTATIPAGRYAGFGLALNSCYDASVSSGISMTAFGSMGGSTDLRLMIQTSRNTPIDIIPGKGECPFASSDTEWSDCVYNNVAISSLASSAKDISFLWSQFSGGKPVSQLDPTEIYGFQWQFQCGNNGNCAIDVTLDNITFVR